jgi:hypothetical protein
MLVNEIRTRFVAKAKREAEREAAREAKREAKRGVRFAAQPHD